MKYIPILIIIATFFACEQRSDNSTESSITSVDTLRFGNFYGTNIYPDITTLELQNSDSTHLFKLIEDSTHIVRIELGKLSHLDLQLISKNQNVTVDKLSKNTFKLSSSIQTEEPDNYHAQLALLNTYKSSGYVIIRRDTTENSETYSETQPFAKLDTIVHYALKIE